MTGMKIFVIYKDRRWGNDDVSWAYDAVKIGFSWPALFFGPFWALAKGLWGYAAILGVLAVGSRIAEEIAEYARSGIDLLIVFPQIPRLDQVEQLAESVLPDYL